FLTNYARPSNSPNAITIENLELRVPVVETPGSLDGMVKAPATKVLPDVAGAELAPGYGAIGSESVVDYGARVDPCPDGTTGTYPPDCVTDTCPTGQVGTPPDCVDEPLFGKLANPVIKAPKKVKSGKKMTIKIKARNKGATNLTSVRVCLKTQKKFVKGKVKRCRVFSNLAAGKTKTAKYKVKTKGGKAGKKTKVQAVVTSAGQVKRTKATVRLKR
ncbi:MAG: CARDB domain-containing protein, partial [Solirubrobacterales bacterium]